MDSNKTTKGTLQKMAEITLQEWVVIGGIISIAIGMYINIVGNNSKSDAQQKTIITEMADMKTMIKELQNDHKTNYKELDKRATDNAISIKILEQRLNEYDKRR